MHHVEGCDRDRAQLLPARVDDYVDRNNPVRFIDAFVDELDLNAAGFARVEPTPAVQLTIRPICSSSTFMAALLQTEDRVA